MSIPKKVLNMCLQRLNVDIAYCEIVILESIALNLITLGCSDIKSLRLFKSFFTASDLIEIKFPNDCDIINAFTPSKPETFKQLKIREIPRGYRFKRLTSHRPFQVSVQVSNVSAAWSLSSKLNPVKSSNIQVFDQ